MSALEIFIDSYNFSYDGIRRLYRIDHLSEWCNMHRMRFLSVISQVLMAKLGCHAKIDLYLAVLECKWQ